MLALSTNMNPVNYTIANALDPSAEFGFRDAEFFEVYTPWMESVYSEVCL